MKLEGSGVILGLKKYEMASSIVVRDSILKVDNSFASLFVGLFKDLDLFVISKDELHWDKDVLGMLILINIFCKLLLLDFSSFAFISLKFLLI